MDEEQPIDLSVRKSSDKGPKERHNQQQQHQQQQQQQQRQQKKPRTGKRVQVMRATKVKLLAIQRIKNGETKAAVSRALGVPESTIRGWCKGEDSIRSKLLSPTLDSPSSSTELIDDNNLVLDMSAGRSRSRNSSDKENRGPSPGPSAPIAHSNNIPYVNSIQSYNGRSTSQELHRARTYDEMMTESFRGLLENRGRNLRELIDKLRAREQALM